MRKVLVPGFITIVTFYLVSCSSKSVLSDDIPEGHNNRNSLDWNGVYTGMLPCADCDGIETLLKLYKDLTYEMNTRYSGRDDEVFKSEGTFTWNKEGSQIILQGDKGVYLVGENSLRMLDRDGRLITGELAEMYILKKELPVLTEKYWKLIELRGEPVKPAVEGAKEAYIIMEYTGNRIIGNGGCNSFHGIYEIKEGSRINISDITSTLMACQNSEQEEEFFNILEMADNYIINEDTLILNKAKMALARFKAEYLK